MNKLADEIGNMSQEELMKLKRELESGAIRKMVESRIQEAAQESHDRICPVCHSAVDDEGFTLTFGPKGLRKRATFCAADCLEYFLRTKIKPEGQYEH